MTIVYAIEEVHQLGKIDQIQSNRTRESITCIITMAYWYTNSIVLDLQKQLFMNNVYRLHVTNDIYLLIANTVYFNIIYNHIQHVDLLLVVDKDTTIGEIGEFMNKLNIGKISHYKEIHTDISNHCVTYFMKKAIKEKKCIQIIFNHWYDTISSHIIQKNMKECQTYTFRNQWKIYFETPFFIQNNPYNYTALSIN
jgi:hypothetical protein